MTRSKYHHWNWGEVHCLHKSGVQPSKSRQGWLKNVLRFRMLEFDVPVLAPSTGTASDFCENMPFLDILGKPHLRTRWKWLLKYLFSFRRKLETNRSAVFPISCAQLIKKIFTLEIAWLFNNTYYLLTKSDRSNSWMMCIPQILVKCQEYKI